MAYGSPQSEKHIYFALKDTKRGQVPYFEVKKKSDDGYTTERCTFIEGEIMKVTIGGYDYKGTGNQRWVDTYTIEMKDGEEIYKFETSWTSLSRGIINFLANIELPGKIKIQVWSPKPKDDEKKSDVYPAVFVTNDGDKVKSKWKYDDLSDLIRTYEGKGGETEKDYSKLDKHFMDTVETIVGPMMEQGFVDHSETPLSEKKEDSDPGPQQEDAPEEKQDDLPF